MSKKRIVNTTITTSTDNKASKLLKPMVDEVLVAFDLLQNDTMALDYCGIEGRDRTLVLEDPVYIKESRKLKAQKFAEEITRINNITARINKFGDFEEKKVGDNERLLKHADPKAEKEMLTLQLKASVMRRELMDASAKATEADEESDALNVYFIALSAEEFEDMKNIELHAGAENNELLSDEAEETPASIRKIAEAALVGSNKQKAMALDELMGEVMEYVDKDGVTVIEEV